MIVKEIFYGVKCNRCEKMFDDGEHEYWNDSSIIEEYAEEGEWLINNGKHYCPECHDYEDNPKKEFSKNVKTVLKFLKVFEGNLEITDYPEYLNVKKFVHFKDNLENYEREYIENVLKEDLISLEVERLTPVSTYFYINLKIKL